MEPKITIVILNWNGYADTYECLKSLEKVNHKNLQIIIVDNGSDNNDIIKLESEFQGIKIIRSEVNLGFTGGNNLGIKYALEIESDFIMLLNNDTVVTPKFINPLLRVFEKNKNAGIVAPIINYFDERDKIWSSGGKINKLRGAGISIPALVTQQDNFTEVKVEFVSGCCMLIPSSVLKKVGLFDDSYFLYSEDTDLCFRVIKNNYEIFISKDSLIYHKAKSSTKNELSVLALYYETRNRLYFIKKNYPEYLIITMIYILATMTIKSIIWFFNGKPNYIQAVIRSFSDFLKGNLGKSSFVNH